jgi:hypothetical protein
MEREALAARIGLAAAGLVVALTALPYGFARAGSVGTYYGVGLVSPAFVALLSVIAAITLLAAARRRSDPAVAAGIAVTVSTFAVVLSVLWALPAREVVSGIPIPSWFGYHPLSVVLATLGMLAAAGWYARTVL